jgi:hypothetical protein
MSTHLSLAAIAQELNRPAVVVAGLQKRFDLPVFKTYSPAYAEFLRKIVHLRILGATEERLADLWKTEKHLLEVLHFSGDGSPTWFLDQCDETSHPERRLLLSNYDMGDGFNTQTLQPGLDFNPGTGGLFTQREIGEDALRVLNRYLKLVDEMLAIAFAESAQIKAAMRRLPALRSIKRAK